MPAPPGIAPGAVPRAWPCHQQRPPGRAPNQGARRHEHPRLRHRQHHPHPVAAAHRRRHPGREPVPRREHPPACRRRVGRRHDHLLGGGVLRSARRARTSSPRCPAAPARSRSARSAPAPGAATTAASGSGGRSSPTRSALRCAGPPPRSPRPRLGADNPDQPVLGANPWRTCRPSTASSTAAPGAIRSGCSASTGAAP